MDMYLTDALEKPKMERLLRVVSGWAKLVDKKAWPSVACRIIDRFYASPDDKVTLQFMSAMSSAWVDAQTVKAILQKVVALMVAQPSLEIDMLSTEEEIEILATRSLLFARLNPMLTLKVVPGKAVLGTRLLTIRRRSFL
jgi:hypothetical protein